MPTYAEKLRDPRWQRRRLETLARDDWTCQHCGARHRPLHVHHRDYWPHYEPWDYPGALLTTLCEECHMAEKTPIQKMQALTLSNGKKPRVTPDGRIALYDVLFAIGEINPRVTVERLSQQYQDVAEVVTNRYNFPGQGSRPTPVIDEQGFLLILSLLPHKEGSEQLRHELVSTYRRYRAGDMSLATEIVERQTHTKQLDWFTERVEAKKSNIARNKAIEEHGGTGYIFAHCSDHLNKAVTGFKAKEIRELASVQYTRDALSPLQLALTRVGELAQIEAMDREEAQGNQNIRQATDTSDAIIARTAKELKTTDPRLIWNRTDQKARQMKEAAKAIGI